MRSGFQSNSYPVLQARNPDGHRKEFRAPRKNRNDLPCRLHNDSCYRGSPVPECIKAYVVAKINEDDEITVCSDDSRILHRFAYGFIDEHGCIELAFVMVGQLGPLDCFCLANVVWMPRCTRVALSRVKARPLKRLWSLFPINDHA